MSAASEIVLSDLTTLLQFSVGANLAFATVLTLYDKVLVRKQNAIADLHRAAKRLKEKRPATELSAAANQAIADVGRLERDVVRFAKQIEHITYNVFRYVAVFCAVIAFSVLCFATYNKNNNADPALQGLTFLTIAPLFLFSFYALFWTSFQIWRFDNRRDRLDDILLKVVAGQ